MTDPIGLQQLHDAGHLVHRPGLAGVHGQPQAELPSAPEEPLVVGHPERR